MTEKINILLVDDEKRNLLTLQKVLEPLNENLIFASSGKEALKLILKQSFALILLDVKMPGIDGYQVAELLRQREGTRETPIIFITAFDKSDLDMFRGYEMGAVDYLIKPIQPMVLLSKARVFVELHRKNLELAQQREIAVAELRKNNELNKTNELLERLKQDAEQFASIASHDLQAPLRHIGTYVEILKQEIGDSASEEQREALEIISSGTNRMKTLIHDLLSLSRIGPQSIELRTIDLNILVREVVETMQDELDEVDAVLRIHTLPTLVADETKIRQVFQNLLGNAVKYRSPSHRLSIDISATESLRHCQIAIKDNGIGISPEHFSRIFQIFQRLHRQHEYSGTGVGLAICKKIIHLHKGEIWLDSKPGEGSTFFLKMPNDLRMETIA